MKDRKDFRNLLEPAYGPTPDAFHRRVQDTLCQVKRETAKRQPIVRRKISWAAAALAALLLLSAVGIAANMEHVLKWITHTAAKNQVLSEAQTMLHKDAASSALGNCASAVTEWISDGEQLILSISLTDPVLETEGHFIPENEEESFLSGLENYGLYHGPQDIRLSGGTAHSMSWDFEWGDESRNEIVYTLSAALAELPDAFTVTVPVACSEGVMELSFDVSRTDWEQARRFADSDAVQAEGYTAQIVDFRATALRTYATLVLTFDERLSPITRNGIVSDYMEGLGVPEGRTDVAAGEGEEIIMAHTASWSEDGLVCTVALSGNPRREYPGTMVYCPRWGMHAYEWEGDMPPLSMEGAVVMQLEEVK